MYGRDEAPGVELHRIFRYQSQGIVYAYLRVDKAANVAYSMRKVHATGKATNTSFLMSSVG